MNMEAMECDNVVTNQAEMMEEFAMVTSTSTDFALHFLNSYNWDKNVALNNFFEDSYQSKNSFKILSWNLDGLDSRYLEERTKSAIRYIEEIDPDLVFLQEIVSESILVLKDLLSTFYDFFVDPSADSYYCGIMIKKIPSVKVNGILETTQFDNTLMDRRLLSLLVDIKGVPVLLMTSHLESLQDGSNRRKLQLKSVFEKMKVLPYSSIFVGDMNIRDTELRQMNGVPEGILDVAEMFNKSPLPTWQPGQNVNISYRITHPTGLRFDRMYTCIANNVLTPSSFEVLITKPDNAYGLHPSDHWGIIGSFQL